MKFLFTCGGTAGHTNPALSVADSLCARYPGTEVLFAGNPKGMEARLIPKAGYPFAPIEVAAQAHPAQHRTKPQRTAAVAAERTAGRLHYPGF